MPTPLSNAFVFLDVADIVDNPTIRHLGQLGRVLSPPAAGGLTVGGRPVVNLTLALNYAFGGTNVWGYHALNLLIHILAGLALFGVVRRTPPRSTLFAFAVALLWTVHPLQTESVTYIIQRAESLMGLFYLLTLYCFIRYADETLARSATDPKRSGNSNRLRPTVAERASVSVRPGRPDPSPAAASAWPPRKSWSPPP